MTNPFADMDPVLKAAVTRYGTPPEREVVKINVRAEASYSFENLPDTIEGWIDWLSVARNEVPAEYRAETKCVLSFDHGYYDDGASADFSIWYERPETDAELIARVNRGIAYVRNQEEQERRTYEALKAKFGQGVT